MKNDTLKPKAQNSEKLVQELCDETLIYDVKSGKAFCLNESSSAIWNECDGNNSIAEIAEKVSNKLNTKISNDFVMLALKDLKSEGLLEEGLSYSFLGEIDRRNLIKTVGLTAAIALPIITGIVSPLAVRALSCLNTCMIDNDCPAPNPGPSRYCDNGCCFDRIITTLPPI